MTREQVYKESLLNIEQEGKKIEVPHKGYTLEWYRNQFRLCVELAKQALQGKDVLKFQPNCLR